MFSERPVSLRSSGLHPFGTVLEIRTFGATYEFQRKEVLPLLSDRRERLISILPFRRSNPPASARHSCVRSGFPGDARRGGKFGLFVHSISSLDSRLPNLRRKSPKVSGPIRESRFGETIGGDCFDHDCRPRTVAPNTQGIEALLAGCQAGVEPSIIN